MVHAGRVIILGAGVSGLSLGWRLAERGVPVEILESAPFVGGLAGTVREDSYCLDFGPHSFFTEDQEIRETVRKLFHPPLQPSARSVTFHYRGRTLDYPITATSVLFQMGLGCGIRATLSYLKEKMRPRLPSRGEEDGQSVEEWAIAHFGEYLYQTFFKPYTEQFWLMPAAELSARAIPTHTRMGFLKTLSFLVRRRLEGGALSLIERERLPTYYPATGYGEIAERIAEKVKAGGGKIHLNSRVFEVLRVSGSPFLVRYSRDGKTCEMEGSRVVSTIPIPLFVQMLRPLPPADVLASSKEIRYRPLLFLGMVTERRHVLSSSYAYLLDRPYNRITEMNKFSEATSPSGENIIAVEIPTSREDAAWRASKAELFERVIGSLEKDRILHRKEVKRLLLAKAPHAYPIYTKGYARHLKTLADYLNQCPGLFTLGRSGEFIYMDADQCIRRAFHLADRLMPDLSSPGT